MGECENCSFPSKKQMAKNVAFSFINVVGEAFKTGKVMASKEVIQKRIAACEGCEFYKDNRCTECGCFLTYKAGLHAETCPRGKW